MAAMTEEAIGIDSTSLYDAEHGSGNECYDRVPGYTV